MGTKLCENFFFVCLFSIIVRAFESVIILLCSAWTAPDDSTVQKALRTFSSIDNTLLVSLK